MSVEELQQTVYQSWLAKVEEEIGAALGITLRDVCPSVDLRSLWEQGFDQYKAAEVCCRSIPW